MPNSPKNRYLPRAKIPEAKFRGFVRCFALDLEATKIAVLTGLNRNTINRLTRLLRLRIAERSIAFAGGPWVKHEGRPVGLRYAFLPSGSVCRILLTENQNVALFPDAINTLQTAEKMPAAVPCRNVAPLGDRVVPTSSDWADLATLKPPLSLAMINARRTIDAFCLGARMRLVKFRGISPDNVLLHLRECEFRFNHRRENLEDILLEMVRHQALV
ncbi:hypothetical protein GC207_06295 [bacterium]|nr:hypothetical protein [bacterium]